MCTTSSVLFIFLQANKTVEEWLLYDYYKVTLKNNKLKKKKDLQTWKLKKAKYFERNYKLLQNY